MSDKPILTPEEGRAIWESLYGPDGPYHPDGTPRDDSARALALAHAINMGSTEEGAAIRAHLITMGWRQP